MIFQRTVQASPILIYTGSIFAYIIGSNNDILLFLFGYFIFGDKFNKLQKLFFEKYFSNIKMFHRPYPPPEGCGPFSDLSFKGSSSFGCPSGHMNQVSFTSTFWILYIYQNNACFETYFKILLLLLFPIIVGKHRINSGCHNLIQVVLGAFFGFICGLFYFKFFF